MLATAKQPKLRFRRGQTVEIEGVRHTFQQAWPSSVDPDDFRPEPEYLFLRERDHSPSQMGEDKLDFLISVQQFRTLSAAEARGKLRPVAPTGPRDPLAPVRKFWCERYDESPCPWSKPALDAFIENVCEIWKERPEFPSQFIPKCWTLKRWVKERGVPGDRPLAAMDRKEPPERQTFPDRLEKIINSAVAWHWSARHREKWDAYKKVCLLVLYLNRRARRKDENAEQMPVPHHSTIYRRIDDAESHPTWSAKNGEHSADKRFNGVRPGLSATKLMETIVIDATSADVLLALDRHKMEIVGRPNFEVAFDVKTRAIVGGTITFEEESLYTKMAVLKRVLLPKTDLIAARPDLKDTLEPYGKPGTVVVDNAWAQVGKSFQDALEDVHIDLVLAPIETPEYKAIVERGIQTVSNKLFHKAPGGVPFPPHLLRKMGIDPSETVVMDLHVIEELFLDAIDDYNRQPHDGLDDVAPIEAWRRECQIHGIEIIEDVDFIEDALAEVFDVSITREGVLLQDVRYHDETKTGLLLERLAPRDPGHRRRRTTIRARAKAKRDPGDLTKIRVWNHVDREYVRLPAVGQEYLFGLNRQQNKIYKDFAKNEKIPFNTDEDKAKARLRLIRKLEAALPGATQSARHKHRQLFGPAPRTVAGTRVVVQTVQPRHDGMGAPFVPSDYGKRTGDAMPSVGIRRGGKAATRKSVRTHREKSSALKAAEAAVERTKSYDGPGASSPKDVEREHHAGPAFKSPTDAFGQAKDPQQFVNELRKKGWGQGSSGTAHQKDK
ncbi:MAG: hypothetical protein AB1490_12030 [Pseudomonadota bacterium]